MPVNGEPIPVQGANGHPLMFDFIGLGLVQGANGHPPMFDFIGLGQPGPEPFAQQNEVHQDHAPDNQEVWGQWQEIGTMLL
jgi:hypothetical protein